MWRRSEAQPLASLSARGKGLSVVALVPLLSAPVQALATARLDVGLGLSSWTYPSGGAHPLSPIGGELTLGLLFVTSTSSDGASRLELGPRFTASERGTVTRSG